MKIHLSSCMKSLGIFWQLGRELFSLNIKLNWLLLYFFLPVSGSVSIRSLHQAETHCLCCATKPFAAPTYPWSPLHLESHQIVSHHNHFFGIYSVVPNYKVIHAQWRKYRKAQGKKSALWVLSLLWMTSMETGGSNGKALLTICSGRKSTGRRSASRSEETWCLRASCDPCGWGHETEPTACNNGNRDQTFFFPT